MSNLRSLTAILTGVLFCSSAFAAEGRASIGFAINAVTSGGFFSQTLERVKVTKVLPGSPAEDAGLLVGDVIVTANKTPIRGSSSSDLSAILRGLKVGDHLRLEVDRSGETKAIDIVGGARK